jgi:hypothetical protein
MAALRGHSNARMAVEREGGLSMRELRTAAPIIAATGIVALGVVAAAGGVANAAINLSITGCATTGALLKVDVVPNCQASTGTINYPTQITVTANKSFLTAFAKVHGIGVKVTYDLMCKVDGGTVVAHKGFTAKSPNHNTQTTILQQGVGSPAPNSCQVQNLSARSLVKLKVGHNKSFTFGVHANGNNGIPGAVWAQYPRSISGAGSTVCADDTGNGNAGTQIQAFQCEQDLAAQWLQVAQQLVHNGDCMTNSGGRVWLQRCSGGKSPASDQTWHVKGTPHSAGQITNGGRCLSAPAKGKVDGTQLTVQKCGTAGFVQNWKAPGGTPV